MSHVVLELTCAHVSVLVNSDTISVHFTIFEVTFIVRVISPRKFAISMHIVLKELTFVNLARLCKIVFTVTVELALYEITLIHVSIELEFALSCFLSIDEATCVYNLIVVPLLSSFAVICVILPFTLVHRSLLVDENSIAASFTLFPLTLVDVSVGMCHSSLAVEKSILCHSLISRAIGEYYYAESLPDTLLFLIVLWDCPLASVLSALLDVLDTGVPEETLAAALGLGG